VRLPVRCTQTGIRLPERGRLPVPNARQTGSQSGTQTGVFLPEFAVEYLAAGSAGHLFRLDEINALGLFVAGKFIFAEFYYLF
jgi:hypothetical protein